MDEPADAGGSGGSAGGAGSRAGTGAGGKGGMPAAGSRAGTGGGGGKGGMPAAGTGGKQPDLPTGGTPSADVSRQADANGCVAPNQAAVTTANALCRDTKLEFVDLTDDTTVSCQAGSAYGLRWQLEVNPKMVTYKDAASYCENLALAGLQWRLPCSSQARSAMGIRHETQTNRFFWKFGAIEPLGPYWTQHTGDGTTGVVVLAGSANVAVPSAQLDLSAEAYARCVSTE